MEDPIQEFNKNKKEFKIQLKFNTKLTKEELLIIYYMFICSKNLKPYEAFSRYDLLENMRKNFNSYKEHLLNQFYNDESLLNDVYITDFKLIYKELFNKS